MWVCWLRGCHVIHNSRKKNCFTHHWRENWTSFILTMNPNSRFDGKVVVVTGARSGIGEAIAVLFAERGASVALCGRDKDRLQNVVEKCTKVSGGFSQRFISVQGDLKNEDVRKSTVDKTVETFGRIDVLIANAGVSRNTKFGYDNEDVYDLIMDTNLKSVYFLTQYAMKHLEKSKGNVVFVSSVMSQSATSACEIYSLGKAALDQLVRVLAFSRARKGNY